MQQQSTVFALPMAPAAPYKKSAPRGCIPAGPWYRTAWELLTDAERGKLEHYTRQGKHHPTVWDSPVQALSAPSKMPGYSWSITAGRTCPGAVYGEGAICSSCYAGGSDDPSNRRTRGYITRVHVRRAVLVREQFCRILCATAAGRAQFAEYLAGWIAANVRPADPFFRIHDSGDFYAPAYVDAWSAVAESLPAVRFWAPTRSWHIAQSKGGRWAESFARLNALPNVAIHPSALHIGEDAPVVAGFAAGSGVKATGWNCPASQQGNACGDCRQCWEPTAEVYYHLH
jgi:hypothetical protein